MKYLLILLFPIVSNANNLEVAFGVNGAKGISDGVGLNYKLGYNHNLYSNDLDIGVTISYEHYAQIAKTLNIRNEPTSVQSDAAKLGAYFNKKLLSENILQFETGLSYFKLSKSSVTPTGGILNGAYVGAGILLSNGFATTKISYGLDYAKNPTDEFGLQRILMQSVKIGVLFDL